MSRPSSAILIVFSVLFAVYVGRVFTHRETSVDFAQSIETFKVNGVPDFTLPVLNFESNFTADLGGNAGTSEMLVKNHHGATTQPKLLGGLQTVTLESLRSKIILINFWATWCEPCKVEFPSLMQLARKYDSNTLSIVAITVDQSPEKIETFLRTQEAIPPTVKILLDSSEHVAHLYGTSKIPETYIVNGQHRLVRKVIREQNWNSPEFLRFFEKMIQGAS